MSTPTDPFGGTLKIDPAVALPPIDPAPPAKTGPMHRVQFVIEFVGPRSVPASIAAFLLTADWQAALGRPVAFSMRASDLQWQPLQPDPAGSYDSLALAWDFIRADGTLSSASAKHLLNIAENFGPHAQRRAVAMPPIADVDSTVKTLVAIRESLDIGFTLSVVSDSGGFLERALWHECARLGLTFGNGSFDWRMPGHPSPLLSVTPFGQTETFSLRGVHDDVRHPGVTIGFHLPLSPAPVQGLDGCFTVARHLTRTLGGLGLDDADSPIGHETHARYRDEIRNALSLFSRAGMVTGSPEARHLFQSP